MAPSSSNTKSRDTKPKQTATKRPRKDSTAAKSEQNEGKTKKLRSVKEEVVADEMSSRIPWNTKHELTDDLLTKIEESETIRTILGFSLAPGQKTRSDGKSATAHYERLAHKILVKGSSLYGSGDPTNIKALGLAIKNRIKALKRDFEKYKSEMNDTGEGVNGPEDILEDSPFENKWQEIGKKFPWYFRVKQLVARSPAIEPPMPVNSTTELDLDCILTGQGRDEPTQATLGDGDDASVGPAPSVDWDIEEPSIHGGLSDPEEEEDSKKGVLKASDEKTRTGATKTSKSTHSAGMPSTRSGVQSVVQKGLDEDRSLRERVAAKETAARTERERNHDQATIEIEKIKQEGEKAREEVRQTEETKREQERLAHEKVRLEFGMKEKEATHRQMMEMFSFVFSRTGGGGGNGSIGGVGQSGGVEGAALGQSNVAFGVSEPFGADQLALGGNFTPNFPLGNSGKFN
ncbi:hypothetical protein FRC09_002802 [Ceratobasidium sp. 395]|nr:hypothetical protein FRC09_002802 [Ceratobasidium sp. 395]